MQRRGDVQKSGRDVVKIATLGARRDSLAQAAISVRQRVADRPKCKWYVLGRCFRKTCLSGSHGTPMETSGIPCHSTVDTTFVCPAPAGQCIYTHGASR